MYEDGTFEEIVKKWKLEDLPFLPKDYKRQDVIIYQWQQNRDNNLKGHFNFYYSVARNSVSRWSMVLYLIILTAVGVVGNLVSNVVSALIGM